MENDVVKCKKYPYLAAYCQKCICQWPDLDENHNNIGIVSLSCLDLFYMAVIADADTDCPQALIQTVPIDYSHLDLPWPQYGFS